MEDNLKILDFRLPPRERAFGDLRRLYGDSLGPGFNWTPYYLHCHLAEQHPGATILDLGTCWGVSASAFAYGGASRVLTFDIEKRKLPVTLPSAVQQHIADATNLPSLLFHTAPLIYLDLDPHDGEQEQKVLDRLLAIGYHGLLFCDDIHLNDRMQTWWENIPLIKYDLTPFGNPHGSGLIPLGNQELIVKGL